MFWYGKGYCYRIIEYAYLLLTGISVKRDRKSFDLMMTYVNYEKLPDVFILNQTQIPSLQPSKSYYIRHISF